MYAYHGNFNNEHAHKISNVTRENKNASDIITLHIPALEARLAPVLQPQAPVEPVQRVPHQSPRRLLDLQRP